MNAVLDAIPELIQAGIELLIALVEDLPTIIVTIIRAIPEIIGSIVDTLISHIDEIIDAGVQLFIALIENLPTIIVEIVKAVPQIISALVDAFGSLFGKMAEVGMNLVRGLWDGITSLATWLWNKVSGWISSIWDGIMDFFGIASPSKEMAWIGDMLVKGLAGSISKNGQEAVDAATGMSEDITNVMQGLSSDIETALPHDFDLATNVKVGARLPDLEETKPISYAFTIEQMVVRSEEDIRRISQELYRLVEQGHRAQGRFSPA